MDRTAVISDCGRYRYSLKRVWGEQVGPYAMFICMNPSTANETSDDPTIRRCVGFARSWGLDGMVMTNLFGWRATNPAAIVAAADPVGPDNDHHIFEAARHASVIIAAWGTKGDYLGRATQVRDLPEFAGRLKVLRLTRDGHPCHPLYLPKDLLPVEWTRSP